MTAAQDLGLLKPAEREWYRAQAPRDQKLVARALRRKNNRGAGYRYVAPKDDTLETRAARARIYVSAEQVAAYVLGMCEGRRFLRLSEIADRIRDLRAPSALTSLDASIRQALAGCIVKHPADRRADALDVVRFRKALKARAAEETLEYFAEHRSELTGELTPLTVEERKTARAMVRALLNRFDGAEFSRADFGRALAAVVEYMAALSGASEPWLAERRAVLGVQPAPPSNDESRLAKAGSLT